MTTPYDLRDRNTEQDFETLLEGLFVLARENYLGLALRDALNDYDEVAEMAKQYVYVEATVKTTIRTDSIEGPTAELLKSLSLGRDDGGRGPVHVTRNQSFLLKKEEAYQASHGEHHCIPPDSLRRKIQAILIGREPDDIIAYTSALIDESTVTACLDPDCRGLS